MGIAKFMETWKRRYLFQGLSIQQRLPLLICVLLLCVMVTFSWISYMSVRNSALKAGRERLNSLTDQLSLLFSQSMQTLVTSTRTTANHESLKKCLLSLDAVECLEGMQTLEKLRQDSSSVLVELLDANRRSIIHSDKNSIKTRVNFDSLLSSFAKLDSGSVGKIYRVRDSIYYPVIAAVTDNNKTIGYVLRWRLFTTTPRAVAQLSQLLGTNATLYIGNTDKTLWTDMVNPISNPLPPEGESTSGLFEYKGPKGNRFIAAEKQIPNTSWLLVIEFSQQTILKSANQFLQWIVIIGSLLMAIGIFIAWIMSRNITRPLNKLTAAVSLIASGKESPGVAIDRKDEVGKLSRAFNAMNSQVRNAKRDLEQKVIETEQMNEQLRNLSAHLQNIREEERIHIAREMHDELGQLLTGFKMDVSWLNKKLSAEDNGPVKEKLTEMMGMVDEAVMFVRRISAELRPSILDDLGLIPALEWHSKEFTKRFNIEVDFQPKVQEIHASGLVATGLFRMYQESLTNVARHSGASKVTSFLRLVNGDICLSIVDNGKGFNTNETGERKTLGLLGMKERALMIGGKLEIKSEIGLGTTIIVIVPAEDTKEG